MMDRFETLIARLESPDAVQRSQAMFQLQPGQINDDRAISALVSILCNDPDLNIVEDATWVLVRYGAAAASALLERFGHENARARHNIAHALGKLADSQTVPHLIAATQDADASVRLKSVYALGQIGDERAIDSLIERLDDPVQDIQWTAREVLEAFGKKALPHLIHALTNGSMQVRELSASLLGDIGDNRAVEPLIAAVETEHWGVRFAIVEALGKIGDTRAVPLIQRTTADTDPRVRAIANTASKMLN
jgi:HEAT repeat protein